MAYSNGESFPYWFPTTIRRSTLVIALFLAPLFIAATLSIVGFTVGARDDVNYLTELGGKDLFTLSPDPVSWAYLVLVTSIAGVSSAGLRIAGAGVATLMVVVLRRTGVDRRAIEWFVISVFPLYFAIYFNQIRLAVALFLFFLVKTSRVNKNLAIPAAMLGHTSTLLFLFLPIVALSPLVVGALEFLDPGSLFAFKLAAYTEDAGGPVPWYLGWELVGLALIVLAMRRNWRLPLEMVAVVVGVRFLANNISLDIGRRILELGIFFYSPVMLYWFKGMKPSRQINSYYVAIGILQLIVAFKSGVIQLG